MAINNTKNRKITTIKLGNETKQRLDRLKEHNRETYDEVLRKMLFVLNIVRKDSEKAEKVLNKIDRAVKSKREYSGVYLKEKGE